jgi:hypothetical protein
MIAEQTRTNPLLLEVLNDFEKHTIDAWGVADSTSKREELWARRQAITLLRGSLDVAIKRWLGDKQPTSRS